MLDFAFVLGPSEESAILIILRGADHSRARAATSPLRRAGRGESYEPAVFAVAVAATKSRAPSDVQTRNSL
jgi:hypothetical protein